VIKESYCYYYYNVGGQRTLQAPHTMQWAVRQQDSSASAAGGGPTSVVNSATARPPTSAVAATTTGQIHCTFRSLCYLELFLLPFEFLPE